MTVRLKKGDNIIRCKGNLDTDTADDEIRREIVARLQAGIPDLVMDMKEVSILSSSGIQLLLAASNTIRSMKQKLTRRNVSPRTMQFLQRLGILENFLIETESSKETSS